MPSDSDAQQAMNGAESLVRTLVDSGVDVCFANPGTSEMHFVGALDRVSGIRPVLGLFEGVVTGCADGYARMAGRPAATLLHLGPGLANGLANLHNARRASSPIVNIVGDHATYHAQYDSPLSSDVVGFARPVSAWVHSSSSARTVAADGARAVQAARAAPGQIATLILPANTAWEESDGPAPPLEVAGPRQVSDAAVARAAAALSRGSRTAILVRGKALQQARQDAAGRISARTGCRLFCDTFAPRLDRGAGLIEFERIPYFAELIVGFLKDIDHLILVGSKPPTAFFAYPDKPSWCLPDGCKLTYLAHEHEDGVGALEALADAVRAPAEPAGRTILSLPEKPTGKFNAYSIGLSVARHLPEGTIISDDGATSSGAVLSAATTARPHVHLPLTGGSIGQGIPVAAGAAVAAPDRKVVCITGDGSGLYTPQALWTIGREQLDVTTIIFTNRAYKILGVELGRVGGGEAGPKAKSMLELRNPDIDWVKLAEGFGIEASRVTDSESFDDQFAAAMAQRGPRLIEAII